MRGARGYCPLVITSCREGAPTGFGANPRLSELQLLAPSSASMLLLPQLLLSSASADLSAAQPTLSLPLVRRRRHHPRATHAARHLSQAAPLPTTEAGPFFGSVPSRLLRTQTLTLAHALAPRDSFIPPLATDPSQPRTTRSRSAPRAGLRRLRRPRDAGRGAWGPDLPPGGRHGLLRRGCGG